MSGEAARWDALRAPVIGPFLRWRHARTTVQSVLLAAAVIVVLHGFLGPQVAPANLATVLSWVHYRGLLVLALLAAGNFFCTGCPFVLLRNLARRLHAPVRRWPAALRGKWIAAALFAAMLVAYELFDLWSRPRATAWIVVAYFAAALAVDLIFAGASFCKYVCPIGQFNFVASTMSPLEVQVRAPSTCRSCATADCVKGRRDAAAPARILRRGCELGLFLPTKIGNLDCTFCLDCVHACPHDNVALGSRVPGLELLDPRRRSSVGRLWRRTDVAAFVLLFAFGGIVNAFGMTAAARGVEAWLGQAMHVAGKAPVLSVIFLSGLVVIPALLIAAATALTPDVNRLGWRRAATAYTFALAPFGFAMWLSHYGFHLLTGIFTIVPVTQSAALDLVGWPALGTPQWRWSGMRPGSVFPIELGLILLGATSSVAFAYLISERQRPDRPLRATLPWAAVIVTMAVAALWILSQPMDLRGLSLGAGG